MKEGTIVIFGFGVWGVVLEKFLYGGRVLHNVHYIDHKTGGLLKCPDPRCDSKTRHCPICGRNLHESELTIPPENDLQVYVKEGMLSPVLVRKHNKAISKQ